MNTKLLYLLLLLIGAFLISFLIGWIIRRSSYKKRYESDINALHDIVGEHDIQLRNRSHMLNKKQEEAVEVENDLKQKQALLENYTKEYNTLESEYISLNNEKKSIEENIKDVDNQVKVLTNEYEILEKEKNTISSDVDKLSSIESDYNAKLDEIKDIESKLETLNQEKESLNSQLSEVQESIKEVQSDLDEQNSKISEITNRLEAKKDAIKDELEDSRVRSLNYEYAIKHVKEKMDANQKVDFAVVDRIIMKNDEKGLFSNFFNKLFRRKSDYTKKEQ